MEKHSPEKLPTFRMRLRAIEKHSPEKLRLSDEVMRLEPSMRF